LTLFFVFPELSKHTTPEVSYIVEYYIDASILVGLSMCVHCI